MRDLGSIPGLGRSSGEGNGYPLQYSGLENSMDRGAQRKSTGSQRVGYDSATKRNEFQSVLVRKEAVKQSEVSQKEKKSIVY